MRSLRHWSILAAVTLLTAPVTLAGLLDNQTFSAIYGFGDSLSDAGNYYLSTGQPTAPYNQRFTNGTTWIEQLAPLVGAAPVTPSLAGGTDYAIAYARATLAGPPASVPVPSVEQQVTAFLASGHAPAPTELYTLWAGPNDLSDFQTDATVPAGAIAGQVQVLADAGARHILVLNLPPIQNTPYGLSLPAIFQPAVAQWVDLYNSTLASDLNALSLPGGTDVLQFDTYGMFTQMMANPGDFGLTNVTDPALINQSPIQVVPNPDQYLFWDQLHPTNTGHALLAHALVPEPASLMLLGTSAMLLLGRRRRCA